MVIVVGAILALPAAAHAQEVTLSGTVTDSTGGLVPQSVGSTDNARPRLVGWNGRARSTPNGPVHRNLRSRGEQEERALSNSL